MECHTFTYTRKTFGFSREMGQHIASCHTTNGLKLSLWHLHRENHLDLWSKARKYQNQMNRLKQINWRVIYDRFRLISDIQIHDPLVWYVQKWWWRRRRRWRWRWRCRVLSFIISRHVHVQCAYANSKAPTDMQNRPVLIWFNWKHNRIYQCVINFKISSTAFHKSYFNELNTRSLLRREI